MCVCFHTCECVCTYADVCFDVICIHVLMLMCVCVLTYICMYVCAHADVCVLDACIPCRHSTAPQKADEQMRFIRELWRRRLSGVQRNVEVRGRGSLFPHTHSVTLHKQGMQLVGLHA